ncbi:YfgM family protein [Nitrosococcus wardiae]|uniref:Ancillary SecYEG translocon subunit n=1 Tax=Nitrosococcus wardiae TaxID=1814290 RepID=A0A4P7BX69_9GAMM|nr:tetratricopeptide repeat protein [Nitrosococcus wardiae]QBQ54728.1 tetratricopeptide repeat protein [Nitrosococcus wardiae]
MALDIYASDQEKSEAIKQWWRENARALLVGIIIGLLALFGLRGWMEYKQNRVREASSLYQQILVAKAQEEANTEIYNSAEHLIQDYSDTPYGLFSVLMLAKEDQGRGDVKAAMERFKRALEYTQNSGLRRVIYLRLARLLLAVGNPEEALTTLAEVKPGSFASAYAELRGDAHVELGQLPEARQAYQEALLDLGPGEPRRQILSMKLDNIAQP